MITSDFPIDKKIKPYFDGWFDFLHRMMSIHQGNFKNVLNLKSLRT